MRPLFPALLSFTAGIVSSQGLMLSRRAAFLLIAASAALLLIPYFAKKKFNPILAAPIFFFLGALYMLPISMPELPATHISRLNYAPDAYEGLGVPVEGVVASLPEVGQRTRLVIEAERAYLDGAWQAAVGKVLLTVNGRPGLNTGDSVRFISRLKEPHNFGNPGEFDYEGRLKMRGIFSTAYVNDPKLIVRTEEAENGPFAIETLRERIRSFIERNSENSGPLKALMISEMGGIDSALKDAFTRTGTWHILSISGLHVGIVAAFSYGLFIFALKRSERVMLALNIRKAAMVFSLAPVVFYGLLAGSPVPTRRAVITVFAFTLTFVLNRGKDYLNTLALAALLILLLSPYSVWDASFQLTFSALFSIVFLTPRLKGLVSAKTGVGEGPRPEGLARVRRFLERRALTPLLVTLAAGLGTSPVIAYHFHRISFTGLLANLLAVPVSGALIPLLFLSSSLSLLWEAPARALLLLSDKLFDLLFFIVKIFSSLPFSSAWVSTPTVLEIALFYSLVASLAFVKRSRAFLSLSAALILALAALWGYYRYLDGGRGLKATFLSVGQGESAFIEFPDDRVMLIDGGGFYNSDFDTGQELIAPFLWSKGVKKIDYLVLSHPQLDHSKGLGFIVANFKVGEFWWNGDKDLGALGDELEDKGVGIKVKGGSSSPVDIAGAKVEFFGPDSGFADRNNLSLVFRVVYGDKGILFTGDIGEAAEKTLSAKNIRATVLKAPHHGSRHSSTTEFLRSVGPSVVIVSAGRDNRFGFPHREALQRYRSAGARVFRTDQGGAITVETDGRTLGVSAHLTEKPR